MRALGAQGTAGLLAGPGQLLEREASRPGPVWQEGHDFGDQAQAAALADQKASAERVPRWVWLVMEALRELRLHAATGTLPGGVTYHAQPGWKVELWEAFWRGRLQAEARANS